jgi:general secretion pathway protein B
MSYILEALKKSERERKLRQPPTLPVLLEDNPPPRRNFLPWILVALLVGLNLAVLFYLGRGERQETAAPKERQFADIERDTQAGVASDIEPTQAAAASKEAFHASGHKAGMEENSGANQEDTSPSVVPERVEQNGPSKKDDSERQVAAAKKTQPLSKSIAVKQTLESSAQPVSAEGGSRRYRDRDREPERRKDGQGGDNANAAAPAFSQPPMRKPPQAGQTASGSDSIPLLSMLPESFRQRIPPLSINMLAISPVPKERFAVINMIKYAVGDQLPGGAVLADIEAESIVLDLDGKRFRITQR